MKTRSTAICAAMLIASVGLASADDSARGSYTNAVVAGKTRTGQPVTIVSGVHQNFPFKGANWDNLLLQVGDKSYSFTSTTGNSPLGVSTRKGVVRISFVGQLSEHVGGVPSKQVSARIVIRGTIKDELLNTSKLDVARALDAALPMPILETCRIEGGLGWIRIGATLHRMESRMAGHIESTQNASLNPIDAKHSFLVYDYVAGVSTAFQAESVPNPVWANGRLFVGDTSIPVSPPVSLTGLSPILFPTETQFTAKVHLGPLVLERRLVSFRTVGNQTQPAYRGLQEVWRWNGEDVSVQDAVVAWGQGVQDVVNDLLGQIVSPEQPQQRRGAIGLLDDAGDAAHPGAHIGFTPPGAAGANPQPVFLKLVGPDADGEYRWERRLQDGSIWTGDVMSKAVANRQ